MRHSNPITMAVIATAVIAVGPGSGASATSKKTTKLSCTIEAFQQGMPNPSAIQFGYVSCPKPFGNGLHHSAFTVTTKPAPGLPGAANGTFKNYYNRGTTKGTFELTIVASNPANLTYAGTITYTGGTGKFKHIKGGGQLRCTSSDGGPHKSCTVELELTFVFLILILGPSA